MAAPVRLQTHVWGPSGGRKALLLHGLCSDGATWWRLGSELADDGWMVIAPDLRGHGRSPAAAAFDVATLAADAAVLGSGWDLVVGHSLGGAIAAQLLADSRDIDAAVLVDPVLRLPAAYRPELRARLREEAGGVTAEAIRAVHPEWDERDVWRKVMATRAVTPDVVDAVLDDNDPWDVTAAVTEWTARVHLLAADPAVGGTLSPELAAELATGDRITYEVADGAGHSIHRERPDLVSAAVRTVVA